MQSVLTVFIPARDLCESILLKHFEAAIERVVAGMEKKTQVIFANYRTTELLPNKEHFLSSF